MPAGEPQSLIAAVDVAYGDAGARAAVVTFADWSDAAPAQELTHDIADVEPYVSGSFYRRELPCILAVLGRLDAPPRIVVVDGYVWLDPQGTPGLGGHLYEALGETTPVVGVAKAAFATAVGAAEVCRGGSGRPLFVTAAGMPQDDAARCVAAMDGPHRIPTLLKRVDQLCRGDSPR